MKAALIPPKGLETLALQSRFHLALAVPELMMRKAYVKTYQRAVRLGDYVVLDNGAAEGTCASHSEIRSYSAEVGAQEIVLPDVLYKSNETLQQVKWYLDDRPPVGPKMAVAQGTDIRAIKNLIRRYKEWEQITCIGIPRHLTATLDRRAVRIELANWIAEEFGTRFEIHMLGATATWLPEIKHIAKYASHVRSIDTSMPFTYALAGLKLSETGNVVQRPANYFEVDHSTRVRAQLVHDNIKTYMEWADAELRAETPSSAMRAVPAA